MDAHATAGRNGPASPIERPRFGSALYAERRPLPADGAHIDARRALLTLLVVFLAYYIAGTLGQATTNIRSSNLGPVWPAYGIALAAFLKYGSRVWPAVAASAFVVAMQGAVPAIGAAGQAGAATLAAAAGGSLLRRLPDFDPLLTRLRGALRLILLGAFGSALISSVLGVLSLYVTGIQPYSGLFSAWLIYWLGDATGVLLVTPMVFTLPAVVPTLRRARALELASLLALLTAASVIVFGDWTETRFHTHVLAFAVLPFVMWGAINFGIAGSALSVFLVATMATILTALGQGPFAGNTPFISAVLLDVLFIVLSITGLTLAAVIAERARAERERETLIREQAAVEARLRLAAIVESSEDAIWSHDLHGRIHSWNAAAQRIFGFAEAEVIGQGTDLFIPPDLRDEDKAAIAALKAGERVVHRETVRLTKAGMRIPISLTISPLKDAAGNLIGVTKIARDITEQQRAREALSTINRKLIQAQEQERARIARELHDDIGQRLALLTSQLTSVATGDHARAARLQATAAEIASDLQDLSHNLHSTKLELLGIAHAFRRFCEEFGDQQKLNVTCETRDVPAEVPSETSLCLYRILQEGLTNSAKHSGARHVEVQLRGAPAALDLVIRDRGAGFDVEAAKASRGIGLMSMEERIKLVSGTLSVQSAPHQGTTIHARVPLPAH